MVSEYICSQKNKSLVYSLSDNYKTFTSIKKEGTSVGRMDSTDFRST